MLAKNKRSATERAKDALHSSQSDGGLTATCDRKCRGFVKIKSRRVNTTAARGFIIKSGRYGGTYAHRDIAFKFASWISVEFELYLIKEFQRIKAEEQKQLGWSAKRELAKINYQIHTDAIKQNLIPPELDSKKASFVYASEADVLNVAMFWHDRPGVA